MKEGFLQMCGIVGVIGNPQTKDILLHGLDKLEYRGYDSAGIFLADGKTNHLVKSKGKIQNLKDKLTEEINGTMGIGHTRWATHGVPSETNAHPHTSESGRFVLVHNGVIENFDELKTNFLAEDTFIGETDTEIAVHLVAYFAEKEGMTTKEAFRRALKEIKGSYAFALIDSEDSKTIYVAKNKSPLLIGLGEGFNVICSDAMAMLTQTDRFVEINDGELVFVHANGIQIEDQAGHEITREAFVTQLDASDTEKGMYPFYMLKEIDEQPAVLRRLAQTYVTEDGQTTIDDALLTHMSQSDRIYVVACGTSYNAGWATKHAIETMTGIPVELHVSSEVGYRLPMLSKHPFFIFLTQSGETADSRQVLVKVNELNLPALTITNVAGSTLSREATYTLLLHAGPEIAVASTKAYTAQVTLMNLLGKALGMKLDRQEARDFDIVHELGLAANAMDTIINEKEVIDQAMAQLLETTRNAFYIGRGADYYVAMEAALKLKEISYIQTEGFAAGELKHGTIALIEEGTPVFGLITDTLTGPHTRGNLKEVESRGANTFVIASEALAKESDQLVMVNVHEFLTPLVTVVPTQLIAYYASLHRGYDVDKPRNLAKAVTVE